MANLAQALKSEIARIARKETKLVADPLRKANTALRGDVAKLKRLLSAQDKEIATLKKSLVAKNKAVASEQGGSQETKHRISAKGVKSLRAKLGLTAEQLGSLVGVSGQTIYLWEREKTSPRPGPLAGLAKLRTMGKKDVQALLEALPAAAKQPAGKVRNAAGRKKTAVKKSPAPRKKKPSKEVPSGG